MQTIDRIGRILVPVADQDAAIAWYTDKLGFSVVADVRYGEATRWVEIAPPGGGTNIALVPPRGDFTHPRGTGIGLESADPKAAHEALAAAGVDVDDVIGGDGEVPLLFFLRDLDGNQLMVAQG